MSELISPDELKQRIVSGSELAILDVREEGVYFDCHLFLGIECAAQPIGTSNRIAGAEAFSAHRRVRYRRQAAWTGAAGAKSTQRARLCGCGHACWRHRFLARCGLGAFFRP